MPGKPRTAARKPAARKPVVRKPAAPKVPTVTPGVLQLDRPEAVSKYAELLEDREPLFAVNGVEYTIPKDVPPAWSIEAYHLATTVGEGAAISYAVSMMIGPEGYEALRTCITLLREDVEALSKIIIDKVLPNGSPVPKAS